MKKFLSILLALTMLLACASALTSCSDVNENDMEKDPSQTITDAVDKSTSAFFSDEAGLGEVLKKAAEKGKYTVSFKSDDLLGGELTKISETIYADKKANSVVSETSVTYKGNKLSATIYGNKDSVAFESESILGNDNALMVNFDKFISEFKKSDIAKLLNLDKESIKAITSSLESALSESDLDEKEMQEKIEKFYDDLIKLMDQSVSTEKHEGPDGKEKDYVVSTYTIDNKSLQDILEFFYDYVMDQIGDIELPEGTDLDDLEKEFKELLKEIDDHMDIDIEIKMYIESKSGAFYKLTVDGDMTIITEEFDYEYDMEKGEIESTLVSTDEIDVKLDGEFVITENEISLTANILADGEELEEEYKIEAVLGKEVDDGNVKYDLSVTVGVGSTSIDVIDATYEYENNGDITIEIKLPKELMQSEKSLKIVLRGNIEVEKKSATITFDELKVGDEKYRFEFVVEIEAVDSIPQFPNDAKDIVEISEEEWEEIVNDIQNSDLAEIIGAINSPDVPEFPE